MQLDRDPQEGGDPQLPLGKENIVLTFLSPRQQQHGQPPLRWASVCFVRYPGRILQVKLQVKVQEGSSRFAVSLTFIPSQAAVPWCLCFGSCVSVSLCSLRR